MAWRYDVDVSWKHLFPLGGPERTIGLHIKAARMLLAPQNTDQSPYGVIMDRRTLARPPDETHDRKALERIAI